LEPLAQQKMPQETIAFLFANGIHRMSESDALECIDKN